MRRHVFVCCSLSIMLSILVATRGGGGVRRGVAGELRLDERQAGSGRSGRGSQVDGDARGGCTGGCSGGRKLHF